MRSTLPVAADMHPSTRRQPRNHTGRRAVTTAAVEAPSRIGPELDKRSFRVLGKMFLPRQELWLGSNQAIWVKAPAADIEKPEHEFCQTLPEHLALMVDLDLVKLEKIEDPDYPQTELRLVKMTRTGLETLLYGPKRGYRVIRYVPQAPGMATNRHQWGEWRRQWRR